MGMVRNSEVKKMVFYMAAAALIGAGAAYLFPAAGPYAVIFACLTSCGVFLAFTRRRYKKIADLGHYLKKVNSGDYSLELPDNEEGELSILKSEVYKVTMALKEQNEALKTDKLKLKDALFDISHQFKTPLTSISVMADLLLEEGLSKERRQEFSDKLCEQIERLKWLTDALLKLSRLDAVAVAFDLKRYPVDELLKRAAGPVLIPAEIKEQTLKIEGKGEILCDLSWTAEALSNIIKNCMEHTPKGGQIRISGHSNPLFTEIRISDNGPGIDKFDLPHIFERFYRGKNAMKNSAGIGLNMSKIIFERQSATIEARNAKEGGAEFIIRFGRRE